MKVVLLNGDVCEVDTTSLFPDCYNITRPDGTKGIVSDTQITRVIDDIRDKVYTCSRGTGSYDECLAKIAEFRKKIGDCKNCVWWDAANCDEVKRSSVVTYDGNIRTVVTTEISEMTCTRRGGCKYDIETTPVLFSEKYGCFYIKHPEGLPCQDDFISFLVKNADKYSLRPRYECDGRHIDAEFPSFKCGKLFGSFCFEKRWNQHYFTLSNSRGEINFYIDFNKHTFYIMTSSSFVETDVISRFQHSDKPINGFDKFAEWIWKAVDDYAQ